MEEEREKWKTRRRGENGKGGEGSEVEMLPLLHVMFPREGERENGERMEEEREKGERMDKGEKGAKEKGKC